MLPGLEDVVDYSQAGSIPEAKLEQSLDISENSDSPSLSLTHYYSSASLLTETK